jgi:hypothetical protein
MRAAPAVMSVDRHAGLALKAPRLPRLELWGGQGAATTRASAEGKPQRVGGVREHRVMLRWRPSSRPAFACSRKRCARGTQLGEIAKANPAVAIGSYPFFDPQHGPNTNVVLRARDAQKLAQVKREIEEMLERVRRAQSRS